MCCWGGCLGGPGGPVTTSLQLALGLVGCADTDRRVGTPRSAACYFPGKTEKRPHSTGTRAQATGGEGFVSVSPLGVQGPE